MTIRGNGQGRARSPHGDWQVGGHSAVGLERGVCPGCGSSIALSGATIGDRVDCRECGETLEVISLHPIDLDYAFDDEDWEDFEDEERDRDWSENWGEEEEQE
jgi:lysine biosynthesis protein LysW